MNADHVAADFGDAEAVAAAQVLQLTEDHACSDAWVPVRPAKVCWSVSGAPVGGEHFRHDCWACARVWPAVSGSQPRNSVHREQRW